MPRDVYPDKVELKNTDFNSSGQEEAAQILVDYWTECNKLMTEFASRFRFSRHHFQRVRDRYLGPADDPQIGICDETRTFGELRDEYGQVKIYLEEMEARSGTLNEVTTRRNSSAGELTDRDIRMFVEGWLAYMSHLETHRPNLIE